MVTPTINPTPSLLPLQNRAKDHSQRLCSSQYSNIWSPRAKVDSPFTLQDESRLAISTPVNALFLQTPTMISLFSLSLDGKRRKNSSGTKLKNSPEDSDEQVLSESTKHKLLEWHVDSASKRSRERTLPTNLKPLLGVEVVCQLFGKRRSWQLKSSFSSSKSLSH